MNRNETEHTFDTFLSSAAKVNRINTFCTDRLGLSTVVVDYLTSNTDLALAQQDAQMQSLAEN
nr:hypothetical protein [uncultured Deefgea sp.]